MEAGQTLWGLVPRVGGSQAKCVDWVLQTSWEDAGPRLGASRVSIFGLFCRPASQLGASL